MPQDAEIGVRVVHHDHASTDLEIALGRTVGVGVVGRLAVDHEIIDHDRVRRSAGDAGDAGAEDRGGEGGAKLVRVSDRVGVAQEEDVGGVGIVDATGRPELGTRYPALRISRSISHAMPRTFCWVSETWSTTR